MAKYVSGHNGRGQRKPRVEKKCAHCGNAIAVTEARYNATRKFCSQACRDGYRRTRTGALHPSYTSISMNCTICGALFVTQPARMKKHQVYCSMECGREGRRRKIAGQPRRGKKEPAGKLAAKKRDKFLCRICGFGLAVHAHHIVPKSLGGSNDLTNLITLCPNHHAMAHAGLTTAEEMRAALAETPTWVLEATEEVRSRGVVNKGFYRTDLKRAA